MLKTGLWVIAAALAVQGLSAANFFPLRQGNSWTYRDSATGQYFTVRVSTPAWINEREYYSISGYADQRVLARVEGDQLLALDEESGREVMLASFESSEPNWWDAHFRMCEPQGQTQAKRATHDGPAGPISSVLAIHYRTFGCADAGVESEQYAENIGMVRRTVQSFAGPRTFDLVSARIGRQRIEVAPHGSFTVSYDAPQSSTLGVKLHIETNPMQTITLPFASGQEYDLVLRDEQDRIVYSWSSTVLFVQIAHELKITGEWSRVVNIPRPAPGNYTLHAWMTTSGGESRYAATAPLIIEAASSGK